MKKVLIITYYWPPMGGGGVHRWLKFVKYLRTFGWEPVVFTTEGANISIQDESLKVDLPQGLEVIRCPIKEPYEIYNRLLGKKKGEGFHTGFIEQEEGEGDSLVKRLAMWVRGAVFIPDAKMLWIRPASKALKQYLSDNPVDAIVSTGPPHTTHLIARKVRKKTGTPWLADFRDPWTNIDWYRELNLGKWADNRHKQLERKVLEEADKVVTVSWSWAADFEQLADTDVEVITNGYDEEDFQEAGNSSLTKAFTLTHAGSFNKDRNPHALWKVLGRLCQEDADLRQKLKIKLIGPTDHQVKKSIQENGMEGNLEMIDSLPHKEVIEHLCSSWLLLLPLNDTPNISGVVPGKLYEYLGAKRPIVCIGKPDGDAGKIIQEAQAGSVTDFGDTKNLEPAMNAFLESYKKGKLEVEAKGITKFSRKTLAGEMAKQLDAISTS